MQNYVHVFIVCPHTFNVMMIEVVLNRLQTTAYFLLKAKSGYANAHTCAISSIKYIIPPLCNVNKFAYTLNKVLTFKIKVKLIFNGYIP